MATGVIKKVVADRGFGFIRPDDGSKDVFFHVNALPRATEFDALLTDRRVSFDTEQAEKGPKAVNVRLTTR